MGKGSQERVARKAFDEGVPHSRTKGNLNKWVTSLWTKNRKADNIRLYGGHAWIFCGEMLVTVLPIPANLMKDMKKMVKEGQNEAN